MYTAWLLRWDCVGTWIIATTEFYRVAIYLYSKGEILEGFDKIGSGGRFYRTYRNSTTPCLEKYESFDIAPSRSSGDEITRISPDIAICSDCLKDRKHQLHRMGYPFINCTHCGPRFSIIEKLPYDRAVTTMSSLVCAIRVGRSMPM